MQVCAESVSRDTLEPDPPGRGAPGADPEAAVDDMVEGVEGLERIEVVELSAIAEKISVLSAHSY